MGESQLGLLANYVLQLMPATQLDMQVQIFMDGDDLDVLCHISRKSRHLKKFTYFSSCIHLFVLIMKPGFMG